MNVNTVLDELKNNVDEHDIRDIAVKVIRKEFSQKYGIYLNEKSIDAWNINTIEESLKTIIDNHIKRFNNMIDARLFYEFRQVNFSLHHIDDNVEFGRYSNSSNSEIVYIIRYAINGIFDKDYSEVNKLLDNPDHRINYDNRMFELKVDDAIKIKSFKNGKLVISGLNQDQKNRIKAGFDIVTKYRNIQI